MDREILKAYYRNHSKVDFSLANASDPSEIIYKLYTKDKRSQEIIVTEDSIAEQRLNKTVKTVLIIHGWTSNDTSPWYDPLRNAYFDIGDFNIIYINWQKYGNLSYSISSANVKPVSEFIAKFLKNAGVPPKNIHLVGHSLGAQLAAFIGKTYENKYNQTIGRITALDPAGPKWSNAEMKEEERLNKLDAHFVDVVHTDIQMYGYTLPIGHVDFYPNGGTDQPGCPDEEQKENCSHHRSTRFFIESVKTRIRAKEINFVETEDYQIIITEKENPKEAIFGEHVDLESRGVFYFKTNPVNPFLQQTELAN